MAKTKTAEKGKDTKGKANGAGKAAAYADPIERFRKAALKLREDKVQPCRADVRVAYANIRQGVTAAFGATEGPVQKANIKLLQAALPELSVRKVGELPVLGQALMLAAGKVAPPASTGEIDEKLAVVRELREPMLTMAEMLAQRGLLSREVVANIRSGSGKYDTASDGAALYALYKENAAKLKGLHPFKAEEFERLHTASQWLLAHLTPGGARPKTPSKKRDAEDMRDRLWTLVVERHAELRVIGYYKFRDAFDTHTPKLQARVLEPKSEDEQAAAPEGEGAAGDEEQETEEEEPGVA